MGIDVDKQRKRQINNDDTFIYWYINVNNFETLMSTNIENIKALI